MKTIAPLVAKPMAIDRFVDAWLKAGDAILVGFDADIAASAATGADRLRLVQIPDANFEAKIAVRQRAHWTDIHDVSGKRIIENRIREHRNGGMITAIDHRKFVGPRNFLKEAHTARTFDAALAVKYNVGTEDFALAVVLFSLLKAARLAVVLHLGVFQPTLPAWSHIGQSTGWFTRRNSITALRIASTFGLWVKTDIPSVAWVLQAIWSFGIFSISTRHIRQLPAMDSFG